MPHYVGLDAGKHNTSICIINENSEIVREGTVPTEPAAIIGFLRGDRRRYSRIGIESISFSPWLYETLAKAGLPIVIIEARHAHDVLKGRLNKTDRNDAQGIAEVMRMRHYKTVHVKTPESQRAKLLLTARKHLRGKRRDIENLIGGVLLQAGLKLQRGQLSSFERRGRALAHGQSAIEDVVSVLFSVRNFILERTAELEAKISQVVECDPICQRLITVPGVGPLAALAFRSAIDVPQRFVRSREAAVHLGLTPRTYQSGATERRGRISKCGDAFARSMLFLSAQVVLFKRTRSTPLQTWGREVVARRGYARGVVAVARKLAVLLHRMWVSGTDFRAQPVVP